MSAAKITGERFGEIVGLLACELEKQAPEEVEAVLARWDDVKQMLPLAVDVAGAVRQDLKRVAAKTAA